MPVQIKLNTANHGVPMKIKVLFVLTITSFIFVSCTSHKETKARPELTTIGYKQEMHKKISNHKGKIRSGLFVYQLTCKGCHGKNTQGAPLPGDKLDWNPRLRQGMPTLLNHTIHGLGDYMPAKGGCLDCRPDELLAAIKYMIELPEIRYDF